MQELSSRRRFLKKSAFAGGGALLGTVALNQISPKIWREPLVFAPNRSYWARTQLPQNPPLTAHIDADVAVLGGGFTGLSAAYYPQHLPAQARHRPGSEGLWERSLGTKRRHGADNDRGPVYELQLRTGDRQEDL